MKAITAVAVLFLLLAAGGRSEDVRAAESLAKLMRTDITVEFDRTPARDALRHIRALTGAKITVRYIDDKRGGLDPETPITLSEADVPALEVLEMVLEQCHGLLDDDPCTWQLRRGVVEVGTKERLNMHPVVRIYDINDLIFFVPKFDNAPDLDLDAALGQATSTGGGQGGGGIGGGNGGGGTGGRGGSIIGTPGEEPVRTTEEERADEVIDVIQASIEPELWLDDRMTVSYRQGSIIVRAPDYVQRQIGGYPILPSGSRVRKAAR